MKKLIYMTLAAALCCSCVIDQGTDSKRTREDLERYATIMCDGYIAGPAAIVQRIIWGSMERSSGECRLFDFTYAYDEVRENEWNFRIGRYNSEDVTEATVKYLGMYDYQRHMFSVSVTAEENMNIWYPGDRSSEIKAVMTTDPTELVLIHPRHPETFDDLQDYWNRLYGEGRIEIDLYRNGQKVDWVCIYLYERESDIITSLDPVIIK